MKQAKSKFVPVEQIINKLLTSIGEDASRDGLLETPKRVAKMYEELLSGYSQNPASIIKTFKSDGHHDLVTVSDIDFYSLCEHHMVPFFGKVHVGYIPNGRIIGLSKFARLTEIYARRLQVQERLTRQIMTALTDHLHPQGVIVHVEAEHLCMSMRGIKKKGAITKTTSLAGDFETNPILVDRFFRHINRNNNTQ